MKLIDNTKWFISHILNPHGDLSAKRFWGGVIVTNCLVLSWLVPTEKDLILGMLLYGCGLLGIGFSDKLVKKGLENGASK